MTLGILNECKVVSNFGALLEKEDGECLEIKVDFSDPRPTTSGGLTKGKFGPFKVKHLTFFKYNLKHYGKIGCPVDSNKVFEF